MDFRRDELGGQVSGQGTPGSSAEHIPGEQLLNIAGVVGRGSQEIPECWVEVLGVGSNHLKFV